MYIPTSAEFLEVDRNFYHLVGERPYLKTLFISFCSKNVKEKKIKVEIVTCVST